MAMYKIMRGGPTSRKGPFVIYKKGKTRSGSDQYVGIRYLNPLRNIRRRK